MQDRRGLFQTRALPNEVGVGEGECRLSKLALACKPLAAWQLRGRRSLSRVSHSITRGVGEPARTARTPGVVGPPWPTQSSGGVQDER